MKIEIITEYNLEQFKTKVQDFLKTLEEPYKLTFSTAGRGATGVFYTCFIAYDN